MISLIDLSQNNNTYTPIHFYFFSPSFLFFFPRLVHGNDLGMRCENDHLKKKEKEKIKARKGKEKKKKRKEKTPRDKKTKSKR